MGIAYNTSIVRDGLVLHLDAANVKSYPGSGSTWSDLSGNGNDGTLTNSPAYIISNKGGLSFDGLDDWGTISTPSSLSSGPLAVDIWFDGIAGAGASGGYSYILNNNSVDTTTGRSFLTVGVSGQSGSNDNKYYAAFGGAHTSMNSGIAQSTTYVTNLTLIWDSTNQYLYGNGNFILSQSLSGPISAFSNTTYVGGREIYRNHTGTVYSIKFYDRALSASEVRQNFEALRGRYGI